jgi:HAD superfamily hydrolase (TIGR01484 family)
MGRPFDKELFKVPDTIKWAFNEPLVSFPGNITSTLAQYPLLVVGSGGSLSGAHFAVKIHEQMTGKMAKAITPLEFISSQVNPTFHAVLFITASGNNKDIINAFERAVQLEFAAIGVICAKIDSGISKIAKLYSHIHLFEYTNPAGKDGFLAVNSLLSTCILIARAYGAPDLAGKIVEKLSASDIDFNSSDWDLVLQRKTIIAVGSGWAWPALIDLESKFTEAALSNVIISDLRNFAHGRHNWFDKKGDESALIVLETPEVAKLARRTMNLLPAQYPRAVLTSSLTGYLACLHLYIQIFHLVNETGKRLDIDPGMPKVPGFGRKIYHIGLSPAITVKNKGNRHIWIQRKVRVSNEQESIVEKSLDEFLTKLKNTIFSGIVFDYDGTLCDFSDRYHPPKQEIVSALNDLLSEDIPIGIATGRGRSARDDLKKVIDKKYWGNITVGNYNGFRIANLSDDLSDADELFSNNIKKADALLRNDLLLSKYTEIKTRLKQISVFFQSWSHRDAVIKRLLEILNDQKSLKIAESEHSVDILDREVSKLKVIEKLRESLEGEDKNILIIGDQGQVGGNDFEMLNLPYSLSVNKVSTSLTTCWNLSPPGLKGSKATLSVLKAIDIEEKTFQLDVKRLERDRGVVK